MSGKRISPLTFSVPIVASSSIRYIRMYRVEQERLSRKAYKDFLSSEPQGNGVSFDQMMAQYTSIK